MPDPTQQSSSASQSAASGQTGAAATQDGAQQSTATQASSTAPQRPAWADDTLWDGEKNSLREDALTERLKEADTLKAQIEERKKAVPESEDGYKVELPDDIKLPDGWEIKPEDPLWKELRATAKAGELTQEQFKSAAGLWVKAKIAEAEANKIAAERHAKSVHDALGTNGAEQVESVRKWMDGFFGNEIGGEFKHTLWTPNIVKGFQRIQQMLTSQGVTSFSQIGREGAPDATKIPGYETMTFEQRMHAARQASRAANGHA